MERNSFFDTCVIINYASFNGKRGITEKCYNYIKNKKANFILCEYVSEEIKRRIKKRKIIYREVLNKILNSDYDFEKSVYFKDLSERDKIYVKKLYEIYKKRTQSIEKLKKLFFNEQWKFEVRIDRFFKFRVDFILIPKDEIDKKLVSILYDFISEYADCRVLASALQVQQKRPVFFFVTTDREHFDSNTYDFVKTDPRLEKYKFPILRNLIFEKELKKS